MKLKNLKNNRNTLFLHYPNSFKQYDVERAKIGGLNLFWKKNKVKEKIGIEFLILTTITSLAIC